MRSPRGHLEVLRLRWLREHDCTWDVWTCATAAEGGRLEVLKWARAHGCPWDHLTRVGAQGNGHLELLQWAVAHRAPYDGTGAWRYCGGLWLTALLMTRKTPPAELQRKIYTFHAQLYTFG